jgi:hypothetical protein
MVRKEGRMNGRAARETAKGCMVMPCKVTWDHYNKIHVYRAGAWLK